jgi:hypothetical protein
VLDITDEIPEDLLIPVKYKEIERSHSFPVASRISSCEKFYGITTPVLVAD